MKVNVEKEELTIDVNGYGDADILGCDDDCMEFFELTPELNCGWHYTPFAGIFW
ncbi:MAG: hypothetical protein PHT84_05785 [Candidatus Pacebacteria bacterium]|nr:hypothetical protein [Candidatus Paceibacterota bacterium]